MEFCSTKLYPNYSYEQPLTAGGMNRPPDRPHAEHKQEMEEILKEFKQKNITAIIAGDFTINAWWQEYVNWIKEGNLCELAGLRIPTCRAGTMDNGMLLAAGSYIPEGI